MRLVRLSDVFDIGYGNSLALQNCKSGNTAFVARGSLNNGISGYIDIQQNVAPFPEGIITVALGGSVLEAFYQSAPFYTGYHIKVLSPLLELSKKDMLVYCAIIRANKYRYNYGRQANKTLGGIKVPHPNEVKLLSEKIKFPIPPQKEPILKKEIFVNHRKWKPFPLKQLFMIAYGVNLDLNKMRKVKSGIPFVSRTAKENGVSAFVESMSGVNFNPSHTISVSAGGSVMECFFQPVEYYSGRDLYYLSSLGGQSIYCLFFIITLLKMEKYRFNYGRQVNKSLPHLIVKLPVTNQGEPDWQFMEDYIKSLPYSSNLENMND